MKTVVITGASRGIGAACAVYFAKRNFNVVINYNTSKHEAEALTSSLTLQGLSAISVKADVSISSEADFLIKTAYDKFKSVDVLINNAGVSAVGLITDIPDPEIERVFNVNLKGAYLCCRAAIPFMVHKKSGKIINISSMWGETGASCEVAYSASKAGVIGLTKALAKELAPSGINVNAISPGLIETSMNSSISSEDLSAFISEIPLVRIGTAEEVAAAAYFLATENSDYITGQILGVNGGCVI